MELKELVANVIKQGAPRFNSALVIKETPDIILIEIDMASKYCESFGYNGGEITISANENSLHLDENYGENDFTVIEFPELKDKGFKSFSESEGRYTLSFALFRDL